MLVFNILYSKPLNIAGFINLNPFELFALLWASSDVTDNIRKLPNKATRSPKLL
jgi:hypothetical protein